MKKTTFLSVLTLFLFVSPSLAQSPTTIQQLRNQLRQERNQLQGTVVQQRQEFKEEKKGVLSELKKKVLTNIYTNIKNRLTKRYDYLQDRKTKVSQRLTKKEQAGKDMTAAKAKLAEFDNYKAPYTADLAALEAKFQEILISDKPLSQVPELRTIAQKVWTDLKNMHQVLIDTLKLAIKI